MYEAEQIQNPIMQRLRNDGFDFAQPDTQYLTRN